ncbi:MAG: tctC, partial [Ramlibacter sp.]|nr:tctC [Ramlibacter sp.]
MNPMFSRPLAVMFAAATAALISAAAVAQPAKAVKLIVPFPAGGTADVLPRILAEKMRAAYPA